MASRQVADATRRAVARPRDDTHRIAWGYAMVAGAFLIMGSIGALVD